MLSTHSKEKVIIRTSTLHVSCLQEGLVDSLMTTDTQSTDKSVAQQLTATIYDLLSYFYVKKIPLSRRVGCVMDGWIMVLWISKSVRDVCMSHQSDWIYYKQPIKFLVFVAGTCNMILLIVSNGNLMFLFF